MTNNKSSKKSQPGNDNIVNEQDQQAAVNSEKDNSYDQKNTSGDFTSEKEMNRETQKHGNENSMPINQSTETENVEIDSDDSTIADNSSKVNP